MKRKNMQRFGAFYRPSRKRHRRRTRAGPKLAAAAGPAAGSLRGGRQHRRDGPPDGVAPERNYRPAGDRREPGRRQRHRRDRGRRPRRAGRLHAAVGQHLGGRDRAGRRQGFVRSAEGPGADRRDDRRSAGVAGEFECACKERSGVRRLGEGATGQGRLRRRRRSRQRQQPDHVAVPEARRHRDDQRELSRHRAGADRHHRRAHPDHVHSGVGGLRAGDQSQHPVAGGVGREALADAPGSADHRGVGLSRLRRGVVDRDDGAGRHAEGDRGQARRGDAQGP